ncbi:unnamed protein product [Calypogeia fissa]
MLYFESTEALCMHVNELHIAVSTNILPEARPWMPGTPRGKPLTAHTPPCSSVRPSGRHSIVEGHEEQTAESAGATSAGAENEDLVHDMGSIASVVRRLVDALSSSLDVYEGPRSSRG